VDGKLHLLQIGRTYAFETLPTAAKDVSFVSIVDIEKMIAYNST
jgi:hypothetical protein